MRLGKRQVCQTNLKRYIFVTSQTFFKYQYKMYLSDDDARFDNVRAFMHRKYLYFRNILVQLNITSSTICREFVLEKVLSASSCPTCQGAGPATELDIVHTCCRSIWSSRPVYSCQCCGCPHRSQEALPVLGLVVASTQEMEVPCRSWKMSVEVFAPAMSRR